MFRRLYELVFGSTPVEFECRYPLADSVHRLQAELSQLDLASIPFQGAFGTVSAQNVNLCRRMPGDNTPLRPRFTGRFTTRSGRVLLTGQFSLSTLDKLIFTLWISLGVVMTLIAGYLVWSGAGDFDLRGPGLLVFGVIALFIRRWICSGDEAWISAFIIRAIGK